MAKMGEKEECRNSNQSQIDYYFIACRANGGHGDGRLARARHVSLRVVKINLNVPAKRIKN